MSSYVEKTIVCIWFDNNNTLHRESFDPESLKIYNPKPASTSYL